MKAILLIDMPKSCADCQIMADKWCYGIPADEMQDDINISERPKWCPLKPLPQKKVTNGLEPFDIWMNKYGWNKCIDAISEETGGKNK